MGDTGQGRVFTKTIDEIHGVLKSFDSTKSCALVYVTSAQRAPQMAKKQIVELCWCVALPEPNSEATLITVYISHLKDGIAAGNENSSSLFVSRGLASTLVCLATFSRTLGL